MTREEAAPPWKFHDSRIGQFRKPRTLGGINLASRDRGGDVGAAEVIPVPFCRSEG